MRSAAGGAVQGEAARGGVVPGVRGLEADGGRAARRYRAVVADVGRGDRAAGRGVRSAPAGRDVLAGGQVELQVPAVDGGRAGVLDGDVVGQAVVPGVHRVGHLARAAATGCGRRGGGRRGRRGGGRRGRRRRGRGRALAHRDVG